MNLLLKSVSRQFVSLLNLRSCVHQMEPMCFVTLLTPALEAALPVLPSYLAGLTELEAARNIGDAEWEPSELFEVLPYLQRDAADGFRSLAGYEVAIADPQGFLAGSFPHITLQPAQFIALVQKFYAPNFRVMRTLLGKQLTGKLRKDLDVVAESTGTRIRECWRHFDNLRRIFNFVEDAEVAIPVYPTIRERFLLGPRLAWLYTCLLFLLRHRLSASDTRRRLSAVPSDTLVDLASAIIIHWTAGAGAAFPPDVAGRALLLLQSPRVHLSDELKAADSAHPPPISLPPAHSSAAISVKSAAMLAPPAINHIHGSRSASQLLSTARSTGNSHVSSVLPSTVLAIASARSTALRQTSDSVTAASLDTPGGGSVSDGQGQGAATKVPPPPPSSQAHRAATVPEGLDASTAAGRLCTANALLHAPTYTSRSADDGSHGGRIIAHPPPLPAPMIGPSLVPSSFGSGGLQFNVFHTAAMSEAFSTIANTASVSASQSAALAGVDTPGSMAAVTVGLGLDPAFLLTLKDFAGRLMRTRQERTGFAEAVMIAFTSPTAALNTPLNPVPPSPASAPVISSASYVAPTVRATTQGVVEQVRKRLEARIPTLLKTLRDMAANLSSVSVPT